MRAKLGSGNSSLNGARSWRSRLGRPLLCGVLVVSLAVSIAGMDLFVGPHPVADAKAGVDDYPAKLKNARQDSLVDPWLFYNRECTSFVAWRLNNDNLVDFDNYYGGVRWSDASKWKSAATKVGVKVDKNPVVGAVAWWAAGTPGSSRGHVAWVKSVTNNGIVIEEYNWATRGGYGTRTLAKTDSKYPSGFIHVGDLALSNVTKPAITGTARVGTKLTVSRGTWTPSGVKVSYSWRVDGAAIPGATAKTFTPTADLVGKQLRVKVTATKSGVKSAVARTAYTAAVTPGVFKNSAKPAISGTARVGTPLTASTGTWAPAGDSYTYQWYAAGKAISGATGKSYTPAPTDLGKTLTVGVSAVKGGYTTATSTSAATTAVAAGTFARTSGPTITGTAKVGSVLTASPGVWSPAATYGYQWLAGGKAISGATKSTYTPTVSDLGKKLTVTVKIASSGYTTVTETSSATAAVAVGTLLNSVAPTVSGTAQVGVTLTASAGKWSPAPTLTYQWYVSGAAVKGATGTSYTPVPADLGKSVQVRVTAKRDGYATAAVSSVASKPTAPGVVTMTTAPRITGTNLVHQTLTASTGTWSRKPEQVQYQWFVDGKPVAGATSATFRPKTDGRVRVRVTVRSVGYLPARANAAVHVFRGFASVDRKPSLTGRAIIGRVLTVHPAHVKPGRAKVTYTWWRDGHRIRHAHRKHYRVRTADEGHRIWAIVRVSKPGWQATTAETRHTLRAAEGD
ncbi:MAG: CHAP domain-containing protein [Nocardioidaceae bacterium]